MSTIHTFHNFFFMLFHSLPVIYFNAGSIKPLAFNRIFRTFILSPDIRFVNPLFFLPCPLHLPGACACGAKLAARARTARAPRDPLGPAAAPKQKDTEPCTFRGLAPAAQSSLREHEQPALRATRSVLPPHQNKQTRKLRVFLFWCTFRDSNPGPTD